MYKIRNLLIDNDTLVKRSSQWTTYILLVITKKMPVYLIITTYTQQHVPPLYFVIGPKHSSKAYACCQIKKTRVQNKAFHEVTKY